MKNIPAVLGLETFRFHPSRKLAVLACMDARLTFESILGLNTGDSHIIRNAGGIVTDDAIRSLIDLQTAFLLLILIYI